MGLDDSEESVCSSTLLVAPPLEEPGGQQVELCQEEEEEEVQISRILWCYCLEVKEEVEQKEACLVLTDQLFGLLHLSDDFTWTNHDAGRHMVRLAMKDCCLFARGAVCTLIYSCFVIFILCFIYWP